MFVKVFQLSHSVFALRFVTALCCLSVSLCTLAGSDTPPYSSKIGQKDAKAQAWVNAMMKSLSGDEMIGQLFMVSAYSNRDDSHRDMLITLIREFHIGGLIFFQGSPYKQAALSNRCQEVSKVPLLIGMDAEWGLAMRLDSVAAFPRQLTVAASCRADLVYQMARKIGQECRRLGVHVNFAPVVDVNSNPTNPVIGSRSFGEEVDRVSEMGIAYMKGLHEEGVLANAKHFPGHGDTDTDSHYALPKVNRSKEAIYSVELEPFRQLQKEGLASVMVAHLSIPSLDSTMDLPSTLSKPIVTGLLKDSLGFQGLIFTDALNMKAVTTWYRKGDRELMALLAGNDVLLFPEDVPAAFYRIKQALQDGELDWQRVEYSVRKILLAKYQAGLDAYLPVETDSLTEDLNSVEKQQLIFELYQSSIVMLNNKKRLIPFRQPDKGSMAVLSINDSADGLFAKTCSNYRKVDRFAINIRSISWAISDSLFEQLRHYHTVTVGLHEINNRPRSNYGYTEPILSLLNRLDSSGRLVVVLLGVSYAAGPLANLSTIVCLNQDNEFTRSLGASAIFGAVGSSGVLPVTAGTLPLGLSHLSPKLSRLRYGMPGWLGIDAQKLDSIDKIMDQALGSGATPGAQVLIAKSGMVIWNKAYGRLQYNDSIQVNRESIYDLASITKVASTAQAMMWLSDRGMIDVRKKLSYYLPELSGTDKGDIRLEDLMLHQAGLKPYVHFYERTLMQGKPDTAWYDTIYSEQYPLQVSEQLFAKKLLQDSLYNWVIQTPLETKPEGEKKHAYKYSDLGFYFLQRIIEKKTGMALDAFMEEVFYAPLGAYRMGFRPLDWADTLNVAPTELDLKFRNSLVKATVHDPGAAMSGGVAGHAGLFSNANDLAKLMQMNLQKGYYGGSYYFFKPETLERFSTTHVKGNRRGYLWDKPDRENTNGPTSNLASDACYGHTGFTGTAVWVDPKYELIYIFLSNRVNPAVNPSLIQQNIRTRIQDVIYRAVMSTETKSSD